MAGYQFVHFEAYAALGKKSKANKGGKRSLSAIAREADRAKNSHPHVKKALDPIYIGGLPFERFVTAAAAIEKAAKASTVKHGKSHRKLRKDAQIGIGYVASHPMRTDEYFALEGKARELADQEIERWVKDVRKHVETEWPGLVQAGCVHFDESHIHSHFILGSVSPQEDFQALHIGEIARKAAQGNDRSGSGKKAGNDAYKSAMRSFQDRYHEIVGLPHGQARLGPKRNRLTRSEWKREQARAEALKLAEDVAIKVQQQAKNDSMQIRTSAQDAAYDLLEHAHTESEKLQRIAEMKKDEAMKVIKESKKAAERSLHIQKEADKKLKIANQRMKKVDQKVRKLSSLGGFIKAIFGFGSVITDQLAEEIAQWKAKARANEQKCRTANRTLDETKRALSKLQNLAPATVQQLQECNELVLSINDEEERQKAALQLQRIVEANSHSFSGSFTLNEALENHILDLQAQIQERAKESQKERKRGIKYEHDFTY